jgi:hypothetical protein
MVGVKKKGKVHPTTCHEGTEEGTEVYGARRGYLHNNG